jgi:hypothetical protein
MIFSYSCGQAIVSLADAEGLLLIGKLEVDQQQAQCTDDAIGYNHWPEHQSESIYQPHHGAGAHNQQHGKAQVARAFCLPGFIYLWDEGDAT